MLLQPLRLFACLLAAGLLSSCATVPETGRRQLLLTSAQQETQLGLTEFQKLKQSTPLSTDAALGALVKRVGQRIAAVAPLPNAKWEFVVFQDDKTVNAFCLPGGKVGIYTGILPITRDEAGMATVIGHEVAHAVARHGGERMSEGLLIVFGGMILDEAMRKNSDETRALALGAYGIGSSLGVALPHSRQQELEADHLGLLYMARAGYDPRAAVEFWRRFADYNNKQGGQPPQFLSTHPVDSTRIAQLEQEIPGALAEYQKAGH
jgi:predicted Zn-dependent protease